MHMVNYRVLQEEKSGIGVVCGGGGEGRTPLLPVGTLQHGARGLRIRPTTEHSCDPRCVPWEQRFWSRGSGKNR